MTVTKADGTVLINTKINTDGFTKGGAEAKRQFSGMAASAKAASAQIESALSGSFSRSVEIAKINIQQMESRIAEINQTLDNMLRSGSGESAESVKLAAERDRLSERIAAARRKLAIDVEIAANKQAKAEEKAAEKARKAVEAEEKKKADAAIKNAEKEWKTFKRASKGSNSAFKASGGAAGRLGSRLKSIAASALFFNLISDSLRKMTDYMGETVMKSEEMRSAMARLEGAAKTAAAPIVQAVTPALVALANAAAKALSFVVRLISAISGKSIRNMTNYAKSMEKGAGAASKMAKSLAGFDEITTLQDKNSGGGGIGDIAPDFSISEVGSLANNVIAQIKAGNWYTVGETISSQITASLSSVNWESIKEKASNIAINIAEGFNGMFANSAMWRTIGTTIAEGFNTAFEFLSSFGQTIDWEGLAADITGGINRMLYKLDVKGAAKAISAWGTGLLKSIVTAIETLDWQQIGTSVVEYVGNIDWSGLVRTLTEGIGAALAGIASLLVGIIETGWDEVVKWWEEVAYEDGEITMKSLLKGIAQVFVGIGTWLKKNVLDPFVKGINEVFEMNGSVGISEVMKEIGTSVSDGFVEGFSKILEALKGPINGVIGMLNKMASAMASGINTAIRAINRMSFTIPDWVPGYGGKRFGFSLSTITAPTIPYLAKGAVIPPNAPFMAVLGDQRHGTNIEAPLETIQQAFRAEVADMVGGMMAGFEASVQVQNQILEAVLAIEIGDTTIGEAAARYSTKQSIIHGG